MAVEVASLSRALAARAALVAALIAVLLAVAVPSDAAGATDPRFGVTAGSSGGQANYDEALSRASAAGIGSIRVNCEWTYIMGRNQQGQSTYFWGGCDRAIDRVRAAGLEPVMFSFYSHADLCTTAPASVTSIPKRQRYPACNGDRGYPEYREFIRRMVSRYGPNPNGYGAGYGRNQISHWEIGNEPNHTAFFPAYASEPAKAAHEYAKILNTAHDAAKSADPSATVLLGGLATGAGGAFTADRSFLSRIVGDSTYPAASNFDVLNFHNYEDADQASLHLRNLRSQLGGRTKPVWVTEISYPSEPRFQQALPFSSRYPLGEAGQAAYLEKVLSSLLDQGVERVFWNSVSDSVNDRRPFCSNSLMFTSGYICPSSPPSGSPPLRAKAALSAYADLIARRPTGGPASPPRSPASLTAKAGAGRVTVDWGDVSDSDLAGYRVHRKAAGGAWSQIATTRASAFTDTKVTLGTTYSYRVTAYDANESAPSAEATARVAVSLRRPAGYGRLAGSPYAGRGAPWRLNEDDGARLDLSAARSAAGTYVADFYAHASITSGERAVVRKLTATYDGHASSRNAALRLYVYSYSRRQWVRVDGPRTGVTSDRSFGWATLSPRDHISSSGEIRFRVRGTRPSGFRTRTDRLRFRLDG